MAIAGPDYDAYVDRKRVETTGAEFKAWLTNNVDLSTPEKQEYYYNMFPFLRDDRLAEIDRQAALQKKMAEINVRGLQSEEDWFFVYGLQQGYITVSEEPLQNLWQEKKLASTYEKGLFSILSRKLFPDKEKFKQVNWQLPSVPTGNGNPTANAGLGVFNYNEITSNVPNTPKKPT